MSIDLSIEKCFKYTYLEKSKQDEKSVFSGYLSALPKDFIYHYPPNIIWKLTSACNLRCKHCFYYTNKSMFNTQNDLTKEEAFNLAKYLVDELNILSVLLTGGEAMLTPYFFDLLKYFKSKNICVNLFSNGTLITEEIADKLSLLLNPKYDNIQISLDGPNAKIHDITRGEGTFFKSINAIKLLNQKGLKTTVACTVTSENVNSLEEFSQIYKNFGIKELRLGKYKVFSEEQAYLSPNPDDLFVNFAKLIKKNIPVSKSFFTAYDFLNYPLGEELFKKYNPPKKYGCNKLCHNHNKVFISADAKLYLCTSSETANLCIGDLRKESFEQIWAQRHNHPLFKPRVDFVCKKCQYSKWCNAGCAALACLNTGNSCNAPTECLYQHKLEKVNV